MKTAILGGTFDPIHNGHLAAASAAADKFQIDKVFFVPAGYSPHKPDPPKASYRHRLRMVELACAADSRFVTSRLEEPKAAATPHYSIDTIERIRENLHPADLLFFIIGADAFAEFPLWHRRQEVANRVEFLVINRPGWEVTATQLGEPTVRAQYLNDVAMPISSTKLRSLLCAQKEVDHWLPSAVMAYIRENHLYVAA